MSARISVAFPRDETLRAVLRELTPPFADLPTVAPDAIDQPCARCEMPLAVSPTREDRDGSDARLLCPWCAAVELGAPHGHLYRVH